MPYFHVVFTLPEELNILALGNPEVIYDLLFHSASETLLEIAADPKHLGARLGILAVLHTWGQTLVLHPHLHCIVPGGGLSPDGERWVAADRRGSSCQCGCSPRCFGANFWLASSNSIRRES